MLELCAWRYEGYQLCHLVAVLCPAVQPLKVGMAFVVMQWQVGIADGFAMHCHQHLLLLPPAITQDA